MKKVIIGAVVLGASVFQVAQAEWVYIGEYGSQGVISTRFNVQALPVVGETIRAEKGVNLRNNRPHIQKGKGWQLGNVVGMVKPGQRFTIEEIAVSRPGSAPGDVWARGYVAY